MRKKLTPVENKIYHYVDGVKKYGPCAELRGDCSGLRGNCTDLLGDLDECELTGEDRDKGVDIRTLVEN